MKSKRAFATGLAALLLVLCNSANVFAGHQGGINVYSYVSSNPTKSFDSSGLIEWKSGNAQRSDWVFDEDDATWGMMPADPRDHFFWQQEYAMANGGYLAGWPDAASSYVHYLDNTGSDFGWDGTRMIKTSWSGRWAIAMALAEAAAFAKYAPAGPITGLQEMPSGDSFQGDGEAKINKSDKNWNLALGSFFIRGSGYISCSNVGSYTMKSATITIEMADRYNFHWGPNPRQTWLEQVGLARSYNRYGGSATLVFSNLYESISIFRIDQALQQGKRYY